jgi:hypothetical protein
VKLNLKDVNTISEEDLESTVQQEIPLASNTPIAESILPNKEMKPVVREQIQQPKQQDTLKEEEERLTSTMHNHKDDSEEENEKLLI